MNYQYREIQSGSEEFEEPRRFKSSRSRRWLIFALIFIPCLLISQTYIFLQPAIYQSTATVLTMAATDFDQISPAADVQHVSIQKEILLGQAILETTADRLKKAAALGSIFSADELKYLLEVVPEPGTNLVHLHAKGPDPKSLQNAVNAWIESYLEIRARFIAENTDKVVAEIHDQLGRIDKQVEDKRSELEQYRTDHNIVSTESADNLAHARLQGLNASLNKAMEEEVKAKAKFDSVLAAISRNEMVVPETDTREMAVLVQQAEKLRDELASIEAQYTKEYIELNPNLRRVREQLLDIEAKITEKASVGKDFVRQESERNYGASREAVIAIKQQLEAHKQQVAEYTSQFAKHEALQQELLNLETVQQETKQRLVDIDVKQRKKYPQVDVVDWASLPDKPISPDYLQESLLAFAVSLGLALTAMLIMDYLNREIVRPPSPVSLGGIHLHHRPQAMLDAGYTEPQRQVVYDPLNALPVINIKRVLQNDEVLTLYQAVEPPMKWIISLLMNGLSLTEITSLEPEDLDLKSLMIIVPGRRNVLMTRRVADLLTSPLPVEQWPKEDEINALLCCAAIDSGLDNPQEINAETVRYTYMLYLIGQGIKLTELTKVVGPLSAEVLLELGKFSPKKPGLPLEQIDFDYL
ncbi:MAG: GumC family protein [Gammaproteobacteria bacterium]